MRDYIQAGSITDVMKLQNRFNLEELYKDHPELKGLISSEGRERRIVTSAFNKLPIFTDIDHSKPDGVVVLGLEGSGNKRTYKQLNSRYIADNGNLWKWKVLVSKSNGASGTLRDEAARITTVPFVEKPGVGYTQSFIGVGSFDSEEEALSAEKYLKTKFARCLLGILKNTQDNPPDRWKYVPLQDFSNSSDVDWSKSISDIDRQLYAKYGLDQNEIDFIESHVKEMK